MKMHDEQNIDPCNEPTPEAGVVPEQEQDTDVLSLIEDVERHLSRIRNVQSKQVQEFTDLSQWPASCFRIFDHDQSLYRTILYPKT